MIFPTASWGLLFWAHLGGSVLPPQVIKVRVSFVFQCLQEVLNAFFTAADVVLQRFLPPLGIDRLSISMILQELCYTGTI